MCVYTCSANQGKNQYPAQALGWIPIIFLMIVQNTAVLQKFTREDMDWDEYVSAERTTVMQV